MSDAESRGEERATWSVQKQLDQLLDRFEAAWSAGEHPKIEQYLSGVSDKEQPALLRELLTLELAYRVRKSEHPRHDEYFQRFPAHAAVIREVFAAASKSQRLTSSQPAKSSGSQMLRCPNGHKILLKGANARPPRVCPICKSTMPAAALETMSYHTSQTNSAVPEIAEPAASRVPKKLGRFELLEMLGEGAFGKVFTTALIGMALAESRSRCLARASSTRKRTSTDSSEKPAPPLNSDIRTSCLFLRRETRERVTTSSAAS